MDEKRDPKEVAHGIGEATWKDKHRVECGKQVWPWVLAVSCFLFFGGMGIGIATHKYGCEYWGRGLGIGTLIAAIAFLLIWRVKRAIDWNSSRRHHLGY